MLYLFLSKDIDRATFRARKERIEAEIVELESRMGNQTEASLERVEVADGRQPGYRLAAPFAALVSGSNKRLMVEM